ncbi:MAG: hypothetical protein Q8R02_02275 [Hyphomonadaceae bacterium]|nr:hypothetical protein [Hyphomonadaceae bacterium]
MNDRRMAWSDGRSTSSAFVRLFCFALFTCAAGAAHAQTVDIPRTPEGRPDFQGVWESRWRTPLERPKEADGPIVAANKADALIAAIAANRAANTALHPDEDFDDGPLLPAAGGGFRTSLIIDPADGKRPLLPAMRDRAKELRERENPAEGPEVLRLTARCLGGAGGTPLTIAPDQMYRQIVQTPSHVVIATENMGDTRIIDLSGRARSAAIMTWYGRSVGRWDGDTLVIETVGLRPDPLNSSASPGQQTRSVVERVKFNTADEIEYSYVIEDHAVLSAPMRVDFLFIRSAQRMFESACHEGNYGLANILRGAREIERRVGQSATPEGR